MPSGKRAKQQRREAATAVRTPPPVRSKGVGGVRPRQASPRALAIGGVVVAIVVIAIVLAVVLGRSSGSGVSGLPKTGNSHGPAALLGAPEANALFNGIPQHGLVLGKPSAPVEMEMFIDVQCPVCKGYEIDSLPTVVQKYIRTGKVQLHLQPWAFIGPQSHTGRLAVIAASFQNKGFQYAKVLYDNQPDNSENTGWLDDSEMGQIAASVDGLDVNRVLSDKNGSEAAGIARKVDELAKTDRVGGTPTILVGRTNAGLHNVLTQQEEAQNQAPTLQDTERAIDAALAQ